MGGSNVQNIALVAIIALLLLSSQFETCHARGGRPWRQNEGHDHGGKHHKNRRGIGHGTAAYNNYMLMSDHGTAAPTKGKGSSSTFSVLHYGAKGDGKTDDTQAFEAAWAEACKVEASTMVVPSGSVFLLKPISFSGPNCQANIVFQLDGKIIAPTSSGAWKSGLLQWIEFSKLKGITIRGKGIIDGQGSVWWNDLPLAYNPDSEHVYQGTAELDSKMPGTKPTALRFYGSTDVTVTGITIQNSPQTHLKFDSCTSVQVSGFTASSPGDSPNTDGIHLQNSQDVLIYSSDLACGDDCISVQTGCSKVYIHDVNCGPGHGISIGGLGKDDTKACVSNITVRNVQMHDTLTGVRIKTWQGGSGAVEGVMFSNIQVSGVKTPILIDQFYCDKSKCANSSSAVALSGINYQNIKGTYTVQPVHLACSDTMPCIGVSLDTIELRPTDRDTVPFCWNAFGELRTDTTPPINCLQASKSKKQYTC